MKQQYRNQKKEKKRKTKEQKETRINDNSLEIMKKEEIRKREERINKKDQRRETGEGGINERQQRKSKET